MWYGRPLVGSCWKTMVRWEANLVSSPIQNGDEADSAMK